MAADDNDMAVLESKLEEYKKASTVMEYQRAIAGLNKFHDQRISEALWEGLRLKEKENFPLVAFFATVSALEAYEKNPAALEVFIQRFRRDYEGKMVEELTLHRAIEVIHIIINEAFQSYREVGSLNDLLLQFFEKKTLQHNNDGIYKTIDSFKFFPKKVGADAPKRLMLGLVDIIAKYLEQQLCEGKCIKEIHTYIDFFTDKIGEERVLQMVKKVERRFKSELFVTHPGVFKADYENGETCAQTAMPFVYSEEFKVMEPRINSIGAIAAQLGGKRATPLVGIETGDIAKEIRDNGVDSLLENMETFQLASSDVKTVLEKLPPVVPAFVINSENQICDILNARYATAYFEMKNASFTLFGSEVNEDGCEMDLIEGALIETGAESSVSNESFSAQAWKDPQLLSKLDEVVGDISVEVRRLDIDKNNFIEKSLENERALDAEPFLGFTGEKQREASMTAIHKEREVYRKQKECEIVEAFKLSVKRKAIETIDNIKSLYELDLIAGANEAVDGLAEIKGAHAHAAEIIKQNFEKMG